MKFFKFLGWSVIGLILLTSLAYGFLPSIGNLLITQGLSNRGFTNISINMTRPTLQTLTIPSLIFHTPTESGSAAIYIHDTTITYSLDSLLGNIVEAVNIEHIKIEWDSSFLNTPKNPSSASQVPQEDSRNIFTSFGSEGFLPLLPFQHLVVKKMDIFNPSAPPTLQEISLSAKMDAQQEKYEGSIHLEGKELLINFITLSLSQDGQLSFSGMHSSTPEDLALELKTSVKSTGSSLKLQGKTTLKLHPIIHTLSALFPLPTEFQNITGEFSGTWEGSIREQSASVDSPIGTIRGNFSLDARMPSLDPIAKDIQLLTNGTLSTDGRTLTMALLPSSSGSVNLSLDPFTHSALAPFVSHHGPRLLTWKIQEPIHVVAPLNSNPEGAQIQTGKFHFAIHNTAEQIEVVLSPNNLRWQKSSGLIGKGEARIFSEIRPKATPSLSLANLELETHASFSLATNQIAVRLHPSSLLRISKLKNETISIQTIEAIFPKGLSWNFDTPSKSWKLIAPTSIFTLPSLAFQGKQWELGKILTKGLMITTTPVNWEVTGETTFQRLLPPKMSLEIPPSAWQTQYLLKSTSASIKFNGQLLAHPLNVGGQVRFNFLTGAGSGTLVLNPIRFEPQTLVLSQLIQPWPDPEIDLTHGTISASAEITFGKATRKSSHSIDLKRLHGIIDFKKVGGFLTPTIMQGLSTRLEIIGENETLRIPPTPLRINTIQSAVELSNTSLLLSTESFSFNSVPTLSIRNMRTHLLGGTIALDKAALDLSSETHEVMLQVRGLDLNEVLRLEQQETVKGTGTLDGALPLSISGKEVTVKQGSIQGRSPGGTLHFEVDKETATAWAESQPNLDLLVKSLENYHYSKLAVDVDYGENGILKLDTRLEGKNPDFRNGVPVHFNLNIEENIPALLKSLSLVKDLENKIETMMTGKGKASNKNTFNPSAGP